MNGFLWVLLPVADLKVCTQVKLKSYILRVISLFAISGIDPHFWKLFSCYNRWIVFKLHIMWTRCFRNVGLWFEGGRESWTLDLHLVSPRSENNRHLKINGHVFIHITIRVTAGRQKFAKVKLSHVLRASKYLECQNFLYSQWPSVFSFWNNLQEQCQIRLYRVAV